jgi:hypothetical protein
MGAKIALLATILLIGVLLAAELWRYYADDTLVTRGQLIKRLVIGVWLQSVLAMALVGDVATAGMRPLQQMLYWTACLLAAVVPLFAAIHEAGIVARQYARRRAELLRAMSGRASGRDAPPPGDRV